MAAAPTTAPTTTAPGTTAPIPEEGTALAVAGPSHLPPPGPAQGEMGHRRAGKHRLCRAVDDLSGRGGTKQTVDTPGGAPVRRRVVNERQAHVVLPAHHALLQRLHQRAPVSVHAAHRVVEHRDVEPDAQERMYRWAYERQRQTSRR